MRQRHQLIVLVLLALMMAGCARLAGLTTPAAEYELYRQSVVSASLEARLQAAFDYLSYYPKGHYRPQVEEWFQRVEPQYFEEASKSRKRLRVYLEHLPKGPHAARARERISELERLARARRKAEAAQVKRFEDVTRRLRDAAAGRRQFVELVGGWLERLISIGSWGQRTHELPHEFIHAYRVMEPAGRCGQDECVKSLDVEFALPAEGKNKRLLMTNATTLEVLLYLEQGRLSAASLRGPYLFSRLAEALDPTPGPKTEGQRRVEALALSIQHVRVLLDERLPEARCAKEAPSPVLLDRACDGLHVRMLAGDPPSTMDTIIVEPLQDSASTDEFESTGDDMGRQR